MKCRCSHPLQTKNARTNHPGFFIYGIYLRLQWNFTKFLVDKNGNIVNRFGPATKPEEFEDKVAELL